MLEFEDIQGLVFAGYGNMPHALYIFLQVQDTPKTQAWLKKLLPAVTNARRRGPDEPKPDRAIQVAFTSQGLKAMGLAPDAIQTFPREFTQGMGHGERTRVLGDTGDSAPEMWQFGGSTQPEVHLLLILFASSDAKLHEMEAQYGSPTEADGLTVVFCQESFRRGVNEPFGFRDGISQPAIEGASDHAAPGTDILKPGEFLLGYTNEYGQPPPMPTVSQVQDAANALPANADDATRRDFGRNGSYLVLRKLSQKVEAFWDYMKTQSYDPAKSKAENEYAKTLLASKCVGRWPSGAPISLTPERDDPQLGADGARNNNFTFMKGDAEGYGCPVGAHIRRCNPRDTLPPNPAKSLLVSNRHRVMRRGRPYEEPAHRHDDSNVPVTDQGLLFVAINADIQRQFEFVQQTWVNNPNFNGLSDSKDPFAADNDGSGIMVIQGKPVRRRLHDLPRFVEMKGGGYFFLPGLKALEFLTAVRS